MSDWIEMHALADGQIEGDAKAEAEARLASSSALKAEYEAVRAVKNAVSRIEPATCTKTWEKCRGRLDEFSKKKRVESFVGRYAWGLCSFIFVVMLAGAILNRMGSDRLGTGDVGKVLSGFTSSAPSYDAFGVDMRSWIQPRDRDALRVVGTQRALLNGYVGTVYKLEDPKGPLAYVKVRGVTRVDGVEPMLEDRSLSAGKINDTNCVTWQSGPDANFLVADRSYEELSEVAEKLR
jgi:hypothetical protein